MTPKTPIAATIWEARTWLTDEDLAVDNQGRTRWSCNAIIYTDRMEAPNARDWYTSWLQEQTSFDNTIPVELLNNPNSQPIRFDLLTLAALLAADEGL